MRNIRKNTMDATSGAGITYPFVHRRFSVESV